MKAYNVDGDGQNEQRGQCHPFSPKTKHRERKNYGLDDHNIFAGHEHGDEVVGLWSVVHFWGWGWKDSGRTQNRHHQHKAQKDLEDDVEDFFHGRGW